MWVYMPSVSAPASACLTKDAPLHSSILASDTALPLTSSGKLLQPASLSRLWKQGSFIKRLCGLIFAPSTLQSGAERWIASLPDSPASRTASPAAARASRTIAGSGPTSCESFASLVRGAWCSKTSADFFRAEEWTAYSQTWPVSGSMRNGQCWARERWAPRTSASGSSSSAWPTARANDSHGGEYMNQRDGSTLPTLVGAAQNWPTPDAALHSGCNTSPGPAGARPNIALAAQEWRTPQANLIDPKPEGTKLAGRTPSDPQVGLADQIQMWMTPMVPNGGRRVSAEVVASKGATEDGKKTVGLESQSAHWPTPAARDERSPNLKSYEERGGGYERRAATELCGAPLFAPGPSDGRWPDIIARKPWLAPATESGICGMADGMALVVDESRRNQLRAIGNGVVPLQAACAVVELVRRLM